MVRGMPVCIAFSTDIRFSQTTRKICGSGFALEARILQTIRVAMLQTIRLRKKKVPNHPVTGRETIRLRKANHPVTKAKKVRTIRLLNRSTSYLFHPQPHPPSHPPTNRRMAEGFRPKPFSDGSGSYHGLWIQKQWVAVRKKSRHGQNRKARNSQHRSS